MPFHFMPFQPQDSASTNKNHLRLTHWVGSVFIQLVHVVHSKDHTSNLRSKCKLLPLSYESFEHLFCLHICKHAVN
uniref:Ovule protein n=1 Tax=Trichuris muris TaxID=70415 RepID=A0A5S6Q5G1_TRIMR